MPVYYNEFNHYAAQWLRELIKAGLIPDGFVDERSILDVKPEDLDGYNQCHFFAGIGGWTRALRIAGWPDDQPVWTGSCPCQPISCAGQRKGHADERHLWPTFHRLIAQRRPATVFGEQVASKNGREWFAAVRADLEDLGYACGGADLCAAGIGAPHIRQRLFWVGYTHHQGLQTRECKAVFMQGWRDEGRTTEQSSRSFGGLEHPGGIASAHRISEHGTGPTNGLWRDADRLLCRDGRWRPVEPGTFPLVDGSARRVGRVRADQERIAEISPQKDQGSRVGRIKGYGNAIVPVLAAQFIHASVESINMIEME